MAQKQREAKKGPSVKGKEKNKEKEKEKGKENSSFDSWSFLEEADAPQWCDLSMEAELEGIQSDDPWFHVVHQSHKISLEDLVAHTSRNTKKYQVNRNASSKSALLVTGRGASKSRIHTGKQGYLANPGEIQSWPRSQVKRIQLLAHSPPENGIPERVATVQACGFNSRGSSSIGDVSSGSKNSTCSSRPSPLAPTEVGETSSTIQTSAESSQEGKLRWSDSIRVSRPKLRFSFEIRLPTNLQGLNEPLSKMTNLRLPRLGTGHARRSEIWESDRKDLGGEEEENRIPETTKEVAVGNRLSAFPKRAEKPRLFALRVLNEKGVSGTEQQASRKSVGASVSVGKRSTSLLRRNVSTSEAKTGKPSSSSSQLNARIGNGHAVRLKDRSTKAPTESLITANGRKCPQFTQSKKKVFL